MSLSYNPSSNATAGTPWNTAFLSDRDVSSQVPINFVPHPGIYISPACFNDGVYDNGRAGLCISNLLASQIRKFVIDLYWDDDRRAYQLCPVKIPTNGSITPTVTGSDGVSLTISGNYQCSSSLTVDSVVSLFTDYLQQTSDSIEARLQYLIFNLHTTISAAQSPPPATGSLNGSALPSFQELLSTHFDAISSYFYTPQTLQTERLNLNASWYRRSSVDDLPINAYFTTQYLSNGDFSTPDGWPSEDYVQMNEGKRIVAGFGTIGSEISGYNTSGDGMMFFGPGVLYNERSLMISSTGNVTNGCFYNPTETSVSQINNSFASSTIQTLDPQTLAAVADNMTVCGVSPYLNATLEDHSADVDPYPYQTFGNQALFSWASGEPQNDSTAGNDYGNSDFRCALMVSTSSYSGHWRVEDCSATYRPACRITNQPYSWRLAQNAVSFYDAQGACAGNSSFDVPRTGLENDYLFHRIALESSEEQASALLDGVWINFNSIAVEDCWVTTGANGTCPYLTDKDLIRERDILVPAIAAFIVLLLTVLTMLVKCNANRRNSKIRKRGQDGWDYEGVPS